MLKGRLIDSYVSRNGNPVFKYELTGTAEEIGKFEASQQVVHKTDNGNPIFFSAQNGGQTVNVGVSQKSGRAYIADLTEQADRADLAKYERQANGGSKVGELMLQALVAEKAKEILARNRALKTQAASSGATKQDDAAAEAEAAEQAAAEAAEAERVAAM